MIIETYRILLSSDGSGGNPHQNGTIELGFHNLNNGNGYIQLTVNGNSVRRPIAEWSYDDGNEKWEIYRSTVENVRNRRGTSEFPSPIPESSVDGINIETDSPFDHLLFYKISIEGNEKKSIVFPDGSGGTGGKP